MKKNKYLTSFFMLAFFSILISNVYCQDLRIAGITYSVTSKTTLNASTDYYLLKDKSLASATAQGYIKTGTQYAKTILTLSEWQTFFKTGHLSSFGKIATKNLNIDSQTITIHYVDKGTTKVVIGFNNNKICINEVYGNLDNVGVISRQVNLNDLIYQKYLACTTGCNEQYAKDCASLGKTIAAGFFIGCMNDCFDKYYASTAPQIRMNLYTILTSGLSIAF